MCTFGNKIFHLLERVFKIEFKIVQFAVLTSKLDSRTRFEIRF